MMFIGIFSIEEQEERKIYKVDRKISAKLVCIHLINCNTIFSLSFSFHLPFSSPLLSLSPYLALFSFFSILSFSFDNTNIDSIGDNKLYYCLMNVRACIRSNLSRYWRERSKKERKRGQRKKNEGGKKLWEKSIQSQWLKTVQKILNLSTSSLIALSRILFQIQIIIFW